MGLTATKTYFNKLVTLDGLSTVATRARGMMWCVKEALLYGSLGVKGGAGAWNVRGSCDAVTYGLDGIDRWTDYTNVIFHLTTAHSWIVLQQTAIGLSPGYYQVLIDCKTSSVNHYDVNYYVSFQAGFTGGGTIARPTATDEIAFAGITFNYGSVFTPYTLGVNCLKSTDGEVTRVFLSYAGETREPFSATSHWMLMFEKAKNPASWWDFPFVVAVAHLATRWEWFTDGATGAPVGPLYTRVGTRNVPVRFTSEGMGVAYYGSAAYSFLVNQRPFQTPDYNGEWVVTPLGLLLNDTISRGRCGELFDCWLAPQSLPLGEYLEAANLLPRRFINLSSMVVAWDGTHLAWP